MHTILHRLRLVRGLSQRALAQQVGVSHPVISLLETGQQRGCHPRTRFGLEQALGVPFDVLIMPDTSNAAALTGDGVKINTTAASTTSDHE